MYYKIGLIQNLQSQSKIMENPTTMKHNLVNLNNLEAILHNRFKNFCRLHQKCVSILSQLF